MFGIQYWQLAAPGALARLVNDAGVLLVGLQFHEENSGSMYSTIGSGTASQATPQGRRHKRAEVGFELAIKRLLARRHDH